MLNYNRAADAPVSARDFVTFNRVVNIMDLGTAAGDCATAFQAVFGPDTAAATAAWDFKDCVKIILSETGLITEADVARRSARDWDTIHVYFLTQAEDVFLKFVTASKGRTSSELDMAIDAFRKKIEAGRRLEIALV